MSHPPRDYRTDIARALRTLGGHLSIGRGGFTLHYENCRLSGYDDDVIKAQAIAMGLPVIDSRRLPFEIAAKLAIHGPMIAVNRPADAGPWHGFSSAPLAIVAAAYRHAGADVHNIVGCPVADRWFAERPLAPLNTLLDDWLRHFLREQEAASLHMDRETA